MSQDSVAVNMTQNADNASSVYETILVEKQDRVGLITLNRPKSLNALNSTVAIEVMEALKAFDKDCGIGAIVITGSERAFAAGADIAEMAEKTFVDMHEHDIFAPWDDMPKIKKPIIAAVSGYALGGGCELALLSDFAIAADTAKFGLPEIKLGILPGIGGTQRLPRAVGQALAMEMILTGRMIDAEEAKSAGLVARVVPAADVLQTALDVAKTIASYNAPAVALAKAAVKRENEIPLAEGVLYERRVFQSTFATEGQKEGMRAFLEKREPEFKHR